MAHNREGVPRSPNVVWQSGGLTRSDREQQNRQLAGVVWFTGLPCSGKSTVAHAVEQRLFDTGHRVYVLDGDNVRHTLCGDLGFSLEDRNENIRRVAEVATLLHDAGLIVLTAFISPLREERRMARSKLPDGRFLEVYCNASLDTCEQRDVKGLYARARRGEIADYTGVSSPYEPPEDPELVVDTEKLSIDETADAVVDLLRQSGCIPANQPRS